MSYPPDPLLVTLPAPKITPVYSDSKIASGVSADPARRFHDPRQVLAFTPYLIGVFVWMLAVGVLCAADWIGGVRHSRHLLEWRAAA